MEARTAKTTSYKDLLQHFQQAEKSIETPQHKKSTQHHLYSKKSKNQK